MMIFFFIINILQLSLSFAIFVMLGGYVVFKKKFCSTQDDVEDDCGYLEQIMKEEGEVKI